MKIRGTTRLRSRRIRELKTPTEVVKPEGVHTGVGGGSRWKGQLGAMQHGWGAVSREWYMGWARAKRQEPDLSKDLLGHGKKPGLEHQAVGWKGILNKGWMRPASPDQL